MKKVRKNCEFSKIYSKGKKITGKYILIFEYKAKEQKFGVVASKKTGNSVYRSRAKRLMREAIRLNLDIFNSKNQYIMVMKSIFKDKYSEIKLEDIEKDLKKIMVRK